MFLPTWWTTQLRHGPAPQQAFERMNDPDLEDSVLFTMSHCGPNYVNLLFGEKWLYGGNIENGCPRPNSEWRCFIANLETSALQRSVLFVFGGCETFQQTTENQSLWAAAITKGADATLSFAASPGGYDAFFCGYSTEWEAWPGFWEYLKCGFSLETAANAAVAAAKAKYSGDPRGTDTWRIRPDDHETYQLRIRPSRYGQ